MDAQLDQLQSEVTAAQTLGRGGQPGLSPTASPLLRHTTKGTMPVATRPPGVGTGNSLEVRRLGAAPGSVSISLNDLAGHFKPVRLHILIYKRVGRVTRRSLSPLTF